MFAHVFRSPKTRINIHSCHAGCCLVAAFHCTIWCVCVLVWVMCVHLHTYVAPKGTISTGKKIGWRGHWTISVFVQCAHRFSTFPKSLKSKMCYFLHLPNRVKWIGVLQSGVSRFGTICLFVSWTLVDCQNSKVGWTIFGGLPEVFV